jgi:hypothetical protein
VAGPPRDAPEAPGAEVVERRFRAQLLTGPPASGPAEATRHLLAVQAQDLRGARLALRARTAPGEGSAEDVDRLLDAGSLIVSWLNRGTLHLVDRADFGWLHALTTPQLASQSRLRLEKEGVSPAQAERGVEVVRDLLTDRGPSTREEIKAALAEAGVPSAGQATVHVLFAATLAGLIVRGPLRGARQTFVTVADWLGDDARPPADEDATLAELARRFLAGHGPASDRDLARWAGITLGRARRGLEAIASELVEEPEESAGAGLVRLAGAAPGEGVPPARMLGSYEPLLMAWDRAPILGTPTGRRGTVTDNGLFRPFALVDGRAVATWRLVGGRVGIEPFRRIPAAARAALDADAADVVRFLGL